MRAARPNVSELRPALSDLAGAAPDLLGSFRILNALVNTLAYNPPGEREEGYLFWASWLNHLGPALLGSQDAHGPLRRGAVADQLPEPGAARQRDRAEPAARRAHAAPRPAAPHAGLPGPAQPVAAG